jgi:hypothetical protein
MLTVFRLGVPGVLRRSLATINPIESALSVTRRVTARLTRRRAEWAVASALQTCGHESLRI